MKRIPAPKLVNSIYQDKAGNLWFGTNSTGVSRYDGTSPPTTAIHLGAHHGDPE